jgi:ribosomal protein S18 acetylase RimI-like enzyme
MNYIIRNSAKKDVPEIVRLICQLAESMNEGSSLTEEYVNEYLNNPSCNIMLAEVDKKIIGLLSYSVKPCLFHAGDSCLIEELIVDKEYRKQGIAGNLIEKLIAEMKTKQCAEISVTTEFTNKAAIAFYKDHGLKDEFLFLESHFN